MLTEKAFDTGDVTFVKMLNGSHSFLWEQTEATLQYLQAYLCELL